MNRFLVLIGWRRSPDGRVIEALRFRTWHSWAGLAIAVGVVAGMQHLWH